MDVLSLCARYALCIFQALCILDDEQEDTGQ